MAAMAIKSMPGVRLAELVASLSLATDLGLGQPQEHVLRQTVIANRLAGLAGLPEEQRAAAFYVSLLAWVGCVSDSHEMSRWFGDDTQVRAASYQVDRAGLPMMRFLLGHLAADGPVQRVSQVGRFMTGGLREVMESMAAHCQTTGCHRRAAGHPGRGPACAAAGARTMGRQGRPGGPGGRPDRARHARGPDRQRDRGLSAVSAGCRPRSRCSTSAGAVRSIRPSSTSAAHNAAQIFGDLDAVDAWSFVINGMRQPRPRDGRGRAPGRPRDLRRLRRRQVALVPGALTGARRAGG